MNMNDLARMVTEAEAGKEEISIAQAKEVLKIVSKLMAMDAEIIALMIKNGLKR